MKSLLVVLALLFSQASFAFECKSPELTYSQKKAYGTPEHMYANKIKFNAFPYIEAVGFTFDISQKGRVENIRLSSAHPVPPEVQEHLMRVLRSSRYEPCSYDGRQHVQTNISFEIANPNIKISEPKEIISLAEAMREPHDLYIVHRDFVSKLEFQGLDRGLSHFKGYLESVTRNGRMNGLRFDLGTQTTEMWLNPESGEINAKARMSTNFCSDAGTTSVAYLAKTSTAAHQWKLVDPQKNECRIPIISRDTCRPMECGQYYESGTVRSRLVKGKSLAYRLHREANN